MISITKPMDTALSNEIDKFKKSIDKLFGNIKLWLSDTDLLISEGTTLISEEDIGTYEVPILIIDDKNGKKIATIKPIASKVILTKWRIDVIGKFDKEIIVFMDKGGPSYESKTVLSNGKVEFKTRYYYKGVKKGGWYWIEDSRRGRALILNRKLFLDILELVSDYEQ
ncbi:MAG: hypothetical protein HQK91_04260 [Nitrospirae bacterium]|nr:hypothetical protein [Nitrospirota bacterium]MBF0540647.1 hypothetical protein [Nitrospirota bacterium]